MLFRSVESILKEFEFPYPDFVVLDKGRKMGEYSVVLVENNRYKGFGYFDESAGFQSAEELRGQVGFRPYYPDTGELLRHFVKKGKGKLIKLPAEL